MEITNFYIFYTFNIKLQNKTILLGYITNCDSIHFITLLLSFGLNYAQ